MKKRRRTPLTRTSVGVGAAVLVGALAVTAAEPATAARAVAASPRQVSLTPNQLGGGTLPSGSTELIFTTANGNWAKEITLPATAAHDDKITIRSNATWESLIRSDALLHASTLRLMTGDQYVFRYLVNPELGADTWVLEDAPTRTVPVADAVPTPTGPRTLMTLQDGRWVPNVTLPAKAGDRDFVRIRSTAAWPSQVDRAGVEASGPLVLTKGNEYTFLYVAEKSKWVVVSSPDTDYKAGSLASGVVPALSTPRTRVVAGNGDWAPVLTLPAGQPAGSRVVVSSSAAWAFEVRATGLNEQVSTGETVAFIVRDAGRWERETVTIDLLMLYSEKAAKQFTEGTMQNRLAEGLKLTNEALENSGANFRFRSVGLRKLSTPTEWTTLNHAIGALPTHAQAQAWRNDTRADAIYYEGTEDGCGLGYLGADAARMVAVGSTSCGTTVMRHELGHNMGVDHANESSSSARGYAAVGSIMGGNAIPFYATPHRYDPKTGRSLGIANRIDAVSAMNAVSAAKAAFR